MVAQSRALLNQYRATRTCHLMSGVRLASWPTEQTCSAKRREETFAAATKGFDEADEGRLLGATQSAAQAANPRTDMDWWTAISTGTPPAGPRTTVMRGVGTNRKGVLRNQIRTSFKQGMPRTGGGAVQVGATPVVRRVREDARVGSPRTSRWSAAGPCRWSVPRQLEGTRRGAQWSARSSRQGQEAQPEDGAHAQRGR